MREINKERFYRMFFIVTIFDAFTQMNLYGCVLKNNSKTKNVDMSQFLNEIFGLNTSASELLENDDELSNKAIQHYRVMSELLEIGKDLPYINISTIISLVKHIEFKNDPWLLKRQHLIYSNFTQSYLAFILKVVTEKEFKSNLKFLQTQQFPFYPLQIMTMVKVFKIVEDKYFEIERLQAIRSSKKTPVLP